MATKAGWELFEIPDVKLQYKPTKAALANQKLEKGGTQLVCVSPRIVASAEINSAAVSLNSSFKHPCSKKVLFLSCMAMIEIEPKDKEKQKEHPSTFVVPYWFCKPTGDSSSANCDIKFMVHKVYEGSEDEFTVKIPIIVNKKVIEEGHALTYYEKQSPTEYTFEPAKKKLKKK